MIIILSAYYADKTTLDMKSDIESIVNDVNIYSDGLILALKNDKFKEAKDYSEKMENHLQTVKDYLKMKSVI